MWFVLLVAVVFALLIGFAIGESHAESKEWLRRHRGY